MQVDKWIDLKSVIPLVMDVIDDNIVDESLILELSYQAMKMLQVNDVFVPKVKFLEVKNYKACLPKDLEKLEMVLHKQLVDYKACTKDVEDYYIDYNNKPALLNPENMVSHLLTSNWKVMLRPTNKFSSTYFCGKEYNFNYTCTQEYNVVPGDIIVTSFKEGIIAIAYKSNAVLDGEFLIPDDEEYKAAIKSYVLKTIWESRYNIKEEGADNRFQFYSLDWALKKANVKGKYKMPSLEEMEQIKWERLRLVPNVEQINTFYQKLGINSTWDLNGKSHPAY